MTKEEILDFLVKNPIYLRESYFKKKFADEYRELSAWQFPEDYSFSRKAYHYLHDDRNLVLSKCLACGGETTFKSIGRGYFKYCSKQCIYTEDRSERCKNTKYIKYGNERYNNIDKAKTTCVDRYGVDCASKCEEIRKKISNTRSSHSDTEKEKTKKKTQYTWKAKSKESIDNHVKKIKKTKWKNHNDKNYNNREKFIETMHSDEYIHRQTEKYRELLAEYKKRDIKLCGGVSRTELETFDFLVGMFELDDVFAQYSSEKYPFKCDFYVKSIDTYIEIQGYWTHGGKAFDCQDKKDIEKLDYWKACSKEKHMYKTAISVWTVRDVEKRNVARSNGLNYLEIFSNDVFEIKSMIEEFVKTLA